MGSNGPQIGIFLPAGMTKVKVAGGKSEQTIAKTRWTVLLDMSKQSHRHFQPRYKILGCFALLHAVRSGMSLKPAAPVRRDRESQALFRTCKRSATSPNWGMPQSNCSHEVILNDPVDSIRSLVMKSKSSPEALEGGKGHLN